MTEVVMPRMGETVDEGTVNEWFKQVGDAVTEGEPLLEIGTDKVDTEIPAPVTGVLAEIRVQQGETVPVATVIAVSNWKNIFIPNGASCQLSRTARP